MIHEFPNGNTIEFSIGGVTKLETHYEAVWDALQAAGLITGAWSGNKLNEIPAEQIAAFRAAVDKAHVGDTPRPRYVAPDGSVPAESIEQPVRDFLLALGRKDDTA